MSSIPKALATLVWDTLRAPQPTAKRIIAMDLPRRTLWEGLTVTILLTVILVVGLMLAAPAPTDPASAAMKEMYSQPFLVAAGQFISALVTVFAVYSVGRWFGGQGSFDGAIALVAWHQFFLLSLALAGMAVGMIVPPVLGLLLLAMVALYFFVLTQFVCALHGFENGLVVFGMVVLCFLFLITAVAFLTGFLAAIFLGDVPNV